MATAKLADASTTQSESAESSPEHGTLHNGARLVGEFFVPGASLILDGKVGSGAVHAVAGLVAKALIGPPGWILIAANSYSKSCANKNLIEQFQRPRAAKEED